MGETAKHRYLKEKVKQDLAQKRGIIPDEFLEEQDEEVTAEINGAKEIFTFTADLLCHSKKIWVEVGFLSQTKKVILERQKEYEFIYQPYEIGNRNLPPEFHKRSEKGTLTFNAINSKLQEVKKWVYDELKNESDFSIETEPKWDATKHKRYLSLYEVTSDFFNLPIGTVTDEEEIRNTQFYCGVALNEFGKYAVYVESTNSGIIEQFMKKDFTELTQLLNQLKYSDKYFTMGGFGYLPKGKKNRPYYHSWNWLREGITDWFGVQIDPSSNDAIISFNSTKMQKEDFEVINEYFTELKNTNRYVDKKYRKYPRLALISVDNLTEEEIVPILKEIGPIYAKVKNIRNQSDIVADEITADYELLEMMENRDYETVLDRMEERYPFLELKDMKKLRLNTKIKKALETWNLKIKEKIKQLKEEGFDFQFYLYHNNRDKLMSAYNKLETPKLCSYDKFEKKCDELEGY